ncbi:MAG TPA: VOC family protein [Stellaceae bacterium]|jgi:catechol 2,3-dioxygenase-like lactoylglutathione lyase family enzyme
MLDQPKSDARPRTLAELPQRLHHHAFVVKDQEINRHFFEDMLGMPLVATWCERSFHPDFGREVDYCHTFFALADGGALAFFQFAENEIYEKAKAILPPGGGWWHVALKASQKSFDELLGRVKAHGIAHRVTDHGYCVSLYLISPDGLKVEFTVDAADVEAINARRRADAHSELKRWLAGDHHVNNDVRPH